MRKITYIFLLLSAMAGAQIVDIPDANFKSYLLTTACIDTDNDGTYDADADLDNDGEIQETEAASAYRLVINGVAITNLQGIGAFLNLRGLTITNTAVTAIQLDNFELLESVDISANLQLTGAQVLSLPALTGAVVTGNTALTSLSIIDCANLDEINCQDNTLLSMLDITGCHGINAVELEHNHLATIDLSPISSIGNLSLKDEYLEVLILKNGHTEPPTTFATMSADEIPNLIYVCADASEMASFQSAVDIIQNSDTLPHFNNYPVVGNYCTFTPGGNYNTIQGHVTYDIDNTGCDDNDPDQGFIRMNIVNGSSHYAAFTFPNGNYAGYFGSGNFTVSPALENPSIFTVTPPNAVISFPNNNNNVGSQDFCITPNGIHSDLEIVIAPITPARPGFDAVYVIGYRNKGNQAMTLPNGIMLQYNNDVLDFVSASEAVSMQVSNSLNWDYQNLLPFESRYIMVTFHVNAPTDTPAVNIGDLLQFTVTISPENNDESVDDNHFPYTQAVVGSFDPNDITCLEGSTVASEEIGEYLHYIVNFENTGTFTAENIVVRLAIDPAKFDVSSLRIMNSSHVVDARLTGSIAELIFKNIALETGGHGNILLKIRSNDNLVTGNTVSKKADIYFDYNFPVATNIATTMFANLSAGDTLKDNSLSIYPNPATDIINVKSDSNIKSVELFDAQGRVLQHKTVNDSSASAAIGKYAAGIYYIRITTDKGIRTEKILKE